MKKALIFVKLREKKLAQQIWQLLYVTKMLQLLVVMDRVRSFVGSRIASRLFKTRVTQTPKQKVRNGRQFVVLLYKINSRGQGTRLQLRSQVQLPTSCQILHDIFLVTM